MNKKVALITGGTKGIGRGIAEKLLAENIHVVITSRSLEDAQSFASELESIYGVDVIGLKFDIEDPSSISALIKDTVSHFGQLNYLVNNALSKNCFGPLDSFSNLQIQAAISANLTNTLLLTNAVYPQLKKTNGAVVSISSAIANRYIQGLPLYGVIKGAINQMTKVLADEWAKDNIRVNAITPGFIWTDAFADQGMPDELIKANYDMYQQYCPINRIGKPEDVGQMVAFLVSESASYITGSIFDVDGGYSGQGVMLYQE